MAKLENSLRANLNRLVVVVAVLVVLKLFTYFFQEFVPIFSQVAGKLFAAFLPFILALLIAFLLEPAVAYLMRILRLRRTYAAFLALFLALLVSGLFLFLLVAKLYTELSTLAVSLPNYQLVVDFLNQKLDSLEQLININPQVQNTIYASTESLMKSVQDWAKTGSVVLLGFLAALPGVFVVLVVSLVAALLISSSFPNVKRFVTGLFPKRWQQSAHAVSQDLGAAVIGFLRAEAILISVTMVIAIVGLSLLGNDYAVTLGVLSGFMDLLPIVGTGMLYVPWALILMATGAVSEGIKILILWVVMIVVRQMLEPRIMSKNIGIHPLPTLISMYVGLKLLGGTGLILGPIIVIIYEALRKAGVFGRPR